MLVAGAARVLPRPEAGGAAGHLGRGGSGWRGGAAVALAQRESARVLSGGGAGAGRLEGPPRRRRVRERGRGAQAGVGCVHQGLVAGVES